MKRTARILAAALALLLLLPMCGCSSIFEAEYEYAEAYDENSMSGATANGVEIKNYTQLKDALRTMMEAYRSESVFLFSSYTGSVADDLAAAVYEVRVLSPIGAYAASAIDYELNRIVSYYTAEINVTFKRSREEVESIIVANGVAEMENAIYEAVSEKRPSVTVRVYSSGVDDDYVRSCVDKAFLSDALLPAPLPACSVTSYPSAGYHRIYEIGLSYGATLSELNEMSQKLASAAKSIVEDRQTARSDVMSALGMAEYLSLNVRGSEIGENVSTAYGALVDGSADSRGFALGYKALCDELGIECMVVSGSLGPLNGERHFWNIIGIDGDYYHVDTSRLALLGAGRTFLKSDEELWGSYIWDTDVYPECSGGLSYADLAPEAQTQQNDGQDGTDAPEPDESPAEPKLPDELPQLPSEQLPGAAGEKIEYPGNL